MTAAIEENKIPDSNDVEMVQKHQEDTTVEVVKGKESVEANTVSAPPVHIEVPDGGYGWIVVFAVFFVHVFVLGNLYSFGVFYPVYIDEFNGNQAAVAWVGSIGACLMVGLGVVTGRWADQYGNERIVFAGGLFVGVGFALASLSTELWHLYLTQGILAGIGYSMAFISGVSVVGQWFSKRRGLAVGVAVAGSGLGQFAISQITSVLITSGGWRYALRILAIICCGGLLLCSLLIRRLLPRTVPVKGQSSLQYFQDRNFSLLFLGCLMNSLGMFMPYTYLTIYAADQGISRSGAVLIISMVGISSAVGRVAVGWFADHLGKIFMFQICIFSGGASTLCWIACKTFGSLMAYGIIFGFFAGGVISLMPGVAAELFGIKKLGSIIGLLYSSTAIGNLLSAPIGGFLYDQYKTYTPSIAVAGCFLLSGMFLVFFLDLKAAHKDVLVVVQPVSMTDSSDVPKKEENATGYELVKGQDESLTVEGNMDPNTIPEDYEMPV